MATFLRIVVAVILVTRPVGCLPVSRKNMESDPVQMQMNTNPTSYTAATSLSTEPRSCFLSRTQVEDIKSHESDLLYMVVNGEVVVKQHPIDLFVELAGIVLQAASNGRTIEHVWFSRVPCKPCIIILQLMFYESKKPTLHIETWRTQNVETTYSTILQGMGCISTLKNEHYTIVPWEWGKFGEETGTTSCEHYNFQQNTSYVEEQNYFERSLRHISGFDEFCN